MPPRKRVARRPLPHNIMAGVHHTHRHRRRELGHMTAQLHHGRQAIGARLFAEQAKIHGAQRAASMAEEAIRFHKEAAKRSGAKARQSGHRAKKLVGALSDSAPTLSGKFRGGTTAARRRAIRKLMED